MKEEDEKWAKFIWSECLQKSVRVLTFGFIFSSVCAVEKGTEFRCLNPMYQGKVKIQHQDWSNTFQVTLTPDDEPEDPIVIENIMLQDIVYVIDESMKHYQVCHNLTPKGYRIAI